MPTLNRQIVLARRPVGLVDDADFERCTVEVGPPGPGQLLVRVCWLSVDPTQRGWLNDAPGYLPPVQIGEPVRAIGLGQIVESNDPGFSPGDVVQGLLSWQDSVVADARGPLGLRKVPAGVEPTAALSVLGPTGLTAYFGLLDVGRPASGETVFVSGAAGATGSVAGQIARLQGCTVIGTAGGPEKCAWVRDVARFDAVIDYKGEDVGARLGELAPAGVDVYFDNVGGPILEVTLDHLAQGARVVLCGGISSGYVADGPSAGPRNLLQLIVRGARMEGFLVTQFARRFPEAVDALSGWVAAGDLRWAVDVVEGLDQAPAALRRLFTGQNLGKQLLKVAELEP